MGLLVDRSTGDVIPASDHNDTKDYVEDAVNRINTESLQVGGVEIISSAGHVKPIRIQNPDSNGTPFFASDGTTQIGLLDDNGNLSIKGQYLTL